MFIVVAHDKANGIQLNRIFSNNIIHQIYLDATHAVLVTINICHLSPTQKMVWVAMAHFRVVDKLLEGPSDFYHFTRLSDIKPNEEEVKCRAKHRLRSGISFKS